MKEATMDPWGKGNDPWSNHWREGGNVWTLIAVLCSLLVIVGPALLVIDWLK